MIVAEVRDSARSSQMQSEVDDRYQHQQRWQERVDEELDAGADAALSAPNADYEIHRDQHYFPRHVEQKEIARHEYAEHAAGQNQQQRVIAAHLGTNAGPASERRQRHDERRQKDHHQRDSVDPERKAGPPARYPRLVDRGLPTSVSWIVGPP